MKKTILILLSGFLGAGKTTLMLSAADILRAKGMKVACITNDQSEQLVDSKMVLRKEIPLQQIQGGCFCCRFEDLDNSITRIIDEHCPHVILAEAVGSCTDLIATVIKPLQSFHKDKLDIRPLSVVVDPERWSDLVSHTTSFTDEIHYLFRKQLEEAQCILLNKSDLLSTAQVEQFICQLTDDFTAAPVFSISAADGAGVDEWINHIIYAKPNSLPLLDIDYDKYAAGEAQLGWLNASFAINGRIGDVGLLCTSFMEKLLSDCKNVKADIAHLKLWGQDGKNTIKLSTVRNGSYMLDHMTSRDWFTDHFIIWINARVHIDPTQLSDILLKALRSLEEDFSFVITIDQMDCFSPSRPIPTYRMA